MKYLSSFLIILISVSMLFAIIGCASSSPSPPQVAPTQPTQTPSPITPSASQPPATIPQPTPTTPSTPQVEENLKVVVDGNIDDWSSSAFKISDPCGDVSDKAASKKGADLKTVWTFMEEEYLYVAIQLCDAFDPSLLRNYFIDLDFDDDKLPDYDFGLRPYDWESRTAGKAWALVFGRIGNKLDWFNENNISRVNLPEVASAWKLEAGIMEIAIPRVTPTYKMPDSVTAIVRVTDGKLDIDSTGMPFPITLKNL